MVEGNLTGFPVLISLDSDSNLSSHARSNGYDIVFTDVNGSKLSHEIELFNHTAGRLIAWVNVTNLSSITNTSLYMYYGNPSCENQENTSGVWDDGFVMVQHLNETGDTLFDSTSYNNDGASFGAVFNDSGRVDGGREYDGHDYIAVDGFTHSPDGLTAEAWVYRNDSEFIDIFCKGTRYNACDWILYLRTGSDTQGIDFGINNHGSGSYIRRASTPKNTWFYLTATYDTGYVFLYVNGSEVGNGTISSSINNNHVVLDMGNENNGAQNWSGLLDELRVSKVARNSSWVKTSYNTMNSPGLFFSLGSEEVGEVIDRPVVCDVFPLNNSVNVSTSLDMVSFDLIDYQGDDMDYTVVTVPDISGGPQSGVDVSNGRYSVPVSSLQFNMAYTWFVNVTDPSGSGNWTNESFTFTTPKGLRVTNPSPSNGATDVPLNPTLQATISNAGGDPVDWWIKKTNASGGWKILGNDTLLDGNGTVSVIPSEMKLFDTMYWWCVNVTNGDEWDNQTYQFTTNSNPQFSIKWHENIGSVLEKASLVADLNGDGIKDVVQTSNGVVALNGVNGSILWQYNDSEIGDNPSLTIADLNNDGIPEIVLGVYHPVGAIAIHGNNGSVYWKRTDFLGSSHQSCPVSYLFLCHSS